MEDFSKIILIYGKFIHHAQYIFIFIELLGCDYNFPLNMTNVDKFVNPWYLAACLILPHTYFFYSMCGVVHAQFSLQLW